MSATVIMRTTNVSGRHIRRDLRLVLVSASTGRTPEILRSYIIVGLVVGWRCGGLDHHWLLIRHLCCGCLLTVVSAVVLVQ